MRILALDHGTVRIGVAVSDELQMIAQPLEFVPAHPFDDFVKLLIVIIQEKEVGQIIIGMPRNMDGSFGEASTKVKQFIEELKPLTKIPIRTWDERLTSVQANRAMSDAGVRKQHKKEKVDKIAAAILL